MRIFTPDSTNEFFSVIVTEHKGDIIEWNAMDYERGNDRSTEQVFSHINKYWEFLSDETLDKIWACYKEIKDIMDEVSSPKKLHEYLIIAIKKLYKLMPLDNISMWINFKSDIFIPSGIKEKYDISDIIERTYIRSDYNGLILIALALRPIVPIWSEYNTKIKSEVGNTHKESRAMALLIQTELHTHPAMEKLRQYVESNAAAMTQPNTDGGSVAAILGGMGTSELPEWLLGLSVVRRVAVGDLDGNSDKGSIIANVYKYINNNIHSLDKRYKGTVKNKEQSSGDDDDNSSNIEGYKVKQPQADGDLVTLSIFTENVQDVIERLQPTLDPEKYRVCSENTERLMNSKIFPHQITLTQWVIHPVISARGVEHLNKPSLLRIIGICQAVLWDRGFNDLAKLITATPIELAEDTMIGGMEARSLIPKELMDQLIAMYPFFPQLQNKQQGERKSNPGSKAIDAICRDLVREEWALVSPIELSGGKAHMLTPSDIKAQLARFLIDRATRV